MTNIDDLFAAQNTPNEDAVMVAASNQGVMNDIHYMSEDHQYICFTRGYPRLLTMATTINGQALMQAFREGHYDMVRQFAKRVVGLEPADIRELNKHLGTDIFVPPEKRWSDYLPSAWLSLPIFSLIIKRLFG